MDALAKEERSSGTENGEEMCVHRSGHPVTVVSYNSIGHVSSRETLMGVKLQMCLVFRLFLFCCEDRSTLLSFLSSFGLTGTLG